MQARIKVAAELHRAAVAAHQAALKAGYQGVHMHSTDRACHRPPGYFCLTCDGPAGALKRRAPA